MRRRLDPDLEDLSDAAFLIVFGMAGTPGSRPDIIFPNITRVRLTLPTESLWVIVAVDVGDDLHVGMGMRREAGLGGDRVVVPDPQIAPTHPIRVVVGHEKKNGAWP